MRAGQELGRQIRDDFFRSGLGYRLQRLDVAVDHPIANGKGQRHIPVVARGVLRQLALQAPQVVDQRLSDRVDAKPGANTRVVGLDPSNVIGLGRPVLRS